MNRHLALLSIIALVLAATSPTQAVIYGPTGDDGTFNAYQYVTNDRTWDAARFDAQGRTFLSTQGHLVTIKDAAENTFANNVGFNNERWIGLVDATASSSSLDSFNPSSLGAFEGGSTAASPAAPAGQVPVAGQRGAGWRWVDGTPATFHSWNGGEPNNSGEEDAAHFTGTAGLWNDNKAGTTIGNGADSNRDALVEYNTNVSLQNLRAFQAKIVKVQDVQDAGFNVGSVANAQTLRNSAAGSTNRQLSFGVQGVATGTSATANFFDSGATGNFAGDVLPPGITGANDDYTVIYTNSFSLAADTTLTFGFRSDDGGQIRIPGAVFVNTTNTNGQVANSDTLSFNAGRGQADTFGQVTLAAGNYSIEFLYFEDGGANSAGEAFFAPGAFTTFAGNGFKLLGDNTGVATFANPANNVVTHKGRPQVNFPDITNLAQADQVLAGTFGAPNAAGFPLTAHYSVINMNNSGSGNPTADLGAFTTANGNTDDPVFGIGGNSDDFVIQATGFIFVDQPGNYTFGVRSDDGVRLRIDVNKDGVIDDADNIISSNGTANFLYANALLGTGWYPIELTYFERGGGADVELFSAFNPNRLTIANGQNPLTGTNNGLVFALVGDTDRGGLLVSAIVIPEPGTLGLLGLSALALLRRRRAA